MIARKHHPHLTVSAFRTFLAAVSGSTTNALTYERVAELAGIEYIQAAHHIERLSHGRSGHSGLHLLVRQAADDGYQKIELSEKGKELAKLFVPPELNIPFEDVAGIIGAGPLPAFDIAARRLPTIPLGTLTVFLQIGLRQEDFGYGGAAAKSVAEETGISNFPRHLAMLGEGTASKPGYGLVQMVGSSTDRRVKLPELTEAGFTVFGDIASAVLGRKIRPPKKPKSDALERLDDRSKLSELQVTDYVEIPNHEPEDGEGPVD